MADTRCTNPEYQLEVDVMIIEYSLYKGIESTLNLISLQIHDLNDGDDTSSPSPLTESKQEEATRLQQNTSILFNLFNRNHPSKQLSVGTKFNIKLLDFLILLSYYIPRGSRTQLGPASDWEFPGPNRKTYQHPGPLPTTTIQQFQQQRIVNTILRRNWLDLSDRFIGLDTLLDLRNVALVPREVHVEQQPDLYAITLCELIPYFMNLSVEISRAMGDVNDRWIELAAQFMFQSALERLQQIRPTQMSNDIEQQNYTTPIRDIMDFRIWMDECFAWGSVTRRSPRSTRNVKQQLHHQFSSGISTGFIENSLNREEFFSAIFNSRINMQNSDDAILTTLANTPRALARDQERAVYTHLCNSYREKIMSLPLALWTLENGDDAPDYRKVLPKLCSEHPIKLFLTDLVRYVEGIWNCNVSSDVSGKPVLVQIEEGRLEGLDQADFEGFLERCGLKTSQGTDDQGGPTTQVKWAR